jgi:spermidine/putrescine transport system substrate-binding protein
MSHVLHFIPFFLVFLLQSCLCNRDGTQDRSREGEGQVSAASVGAEPNLPAQSTVHLAIWSDFVDGDLLKEFEKTTGIRVEIANYATNEEILAKLQAGATGYDVIVPSEYMVEIMAKLGLIAPLDPSQIPSMAGIEPRFLTTPKDSKTILSLPYLTAYSGIAVNRNQFKDPVTSWRDLFQNDQLKGRIGYTDDARETLGAALKLLGKSINSQSPQDIDAAKQILIDMKTNHGGVVGDDFSLLQRGDLKVAQFYSSDAMIASQGQNQEIEFVIPKEGGSVSTEQLVIVATSPHKKEAHALIDFLLRPESSARLVAKIFASPVVKGVREKLPESLRNHPVIFPDPSKMAAYETIRDVGDATQLYEKAWVEFKSM